MSDTIQTLLPSAPTFPEDTLTGANDSFPLLKLYDSTPQFSARDKSQVKGDKMLNLSWRGSVNATTGPSSP